MPQRGFGCFVKWFYLALIVQAFLCIGQIECRQHHQQHRNSNNNNSNTNSNSNSNNNKNKRGDSESSEENHSQGTDRDGFEYPDSNSSLGVGNEGGGGGGGGGGHTGAGGNRQNQRKKLQGGGNTHNSRHNRQDETGLSLWISDQQLKMLTALYFPQAYAQRIYAIHNNRVTNEMRDTTVYNYLVIPSEVNYVNFTWKSGKRKYFYDFDRLQTLDESILKAPTLSISKRGRIPQEQKNFSIFLPCTGNSSGTAQFSVGLKIQTKKNKPLSGTPIRLNFKKECAHRAPDPECGLKCGKNGYCTDDRICRCNPGYSGQYCETAFCFPQCLNGGNCTEPSVCTCPEGYQGTQCEGGICKEKCMNGGKCIQKDKCQCTKGYYGLHCEYSKCVIPCKNGGRCIGNNLCRCPNGLRGDHCEIGRKQRSTCKCSHGGICLGNKGCKCQHGYQGRHCRRRIPNYRGH